MLDVHDSVVNKQPWMLQVHPLSTSPMIQFASSDSKKESLEATKAAPPTNPPTNQPNPPPPTHQPTSVQVLSPSGTRDGNSFEDEVGGVSIFFMATARNTRHVYLFQNLHTKPFRYPFPELIYLFQNYTPVSV